MACLLKLPVAGSKGVVTFTTLEQRVINKSPLLQESLKSLKSQYLTGLHFNWHNYQFKPDSKFDFFMAGEGDLIPVNNEPYHLFPMDACNFTPEIYTPTNADKFWDVLVVGNPVYFKRPEVVLQTIRKLFDEANRPYRVLYICPIPNYKKADEKTAFYNIREYYEALFTKEEQNWFTLLTTSFNSPFPFDRHTLSVFFRNSRVFLHCATEERRCRIAAYAWCAGLPVVAYSSVASILPNELKCEPAYFCVENDGDYVAKIISAIQTVNSFNPDAYRKVLSENYTVSNLDARLQSLFAELKLPYQGGLLSKNLDIRLGWHHQQISGVSNGLIQPLDQFMSMLQDASSKPPEFNVMLSDVEYPERILAGEGSDELKGNAADILKNSAYLKSQSIFYRLYHAVKTKLFNQLNPF